MIKICSISSPSVFIQVKDMIYRFFRRKVTKMLKKEVFIVICAGIITLAGQKTPQQEEIKRLIKTLASNDKAKVIEAQNRLEEMGKPAIPYLLKAIKKACNRKRTKLASKLGDILLKIHIPASPLRDAKIGAWAKYKFKARFLHGGMESAKLETVARITITKVAGQKVGLQIKPEKKGKIRPGLLGACCGRSTTSWIRKRIKKVDINSYIHAQLKRIKLLYNGPVRLVFGRPDFIKKEASSGEIRVAGKRWDCIKIRIISKYPCNMPHCYGATMVRTYWFNKEVPVMGILKMRIDVSWENGVCNARSEAELIAYNKGGKDVEKK
jgi:hypothetical protein